MSGKHKKQKQKQEKLLSTSMLNQSGPRDSALSSAFNVDQSRSHIRRSKYTTNQSDLIAPALSSGLKHDHGPSGVLSEVGASSILFANPSIAHSSIVPHVFTQDTSANPEEIRKASLLRGGYMMMTTSKTNIANKKWYILACSIFCFAATFHCLLSLSALETSIETHYNLSNTAFGSLGTATFGAAMIAAMVVPYFVNKFDLYKIVIIAQICAMIGQALTVISHSSIGKRDLTFVVLYTGRGFVGFAIGIDSVSIQALIGLWFRESPKKALAFALVNNSIQIGIA